MPTTKLALSILAITITTLIYGTNAGYIDIARTDNIDNAEQFHESTDVVSDNAEPIKLEVDGLERARQVVPEDSILYSELEFIYTNLPKQKAQLLIAIAGVESGLGTSEMARTCNNAWGYLYEGTSRRGCYGSKWNTPHNAVVRFIELEENNWLDKFDGSYASLGQYVGKGRYCASSCEVWQDTVWHFYNELNVK